MYRIICLILGGVTYAKKNVCKIWKKDQDSGGWATQLKHMLVETGDISQKYLHALNLSVWSQKVLWKSIEDIPACCSTIKMVLKWLGKWKSYNILHIQGPSLDVSTHGVHTNRSHMDARGQNAPSENFSAHMPGYEDMQEWAPGNCYLQNAGFALPSLVSSWLLEST